MIEQQLIALVVGITLLIGVLDGIAYMFGGRFPFARWTFRMIRRAIGGTFTGIGKAISGGGKKK